MKPIRGKVNLSIVSSGEAIRRRRCPKKVLYYYLPAMKENGN